MAAGDLTSLTNVKNFLPNMGTATSYDTLLGQLITAASAWIKSYLNRDILTASYTETLDGTGTAKIMLPQFPVTAVTSITIGGQAVNLSTVVIRGSVLTLADGSKFSRGYGNVVVAYTAGYATSPADIEQDCIKIVAWWFKERDRLGLASKSLQTGGEVESYQTLDVPADVKTSLNNWRKVVPV